MKQAKFGINFGGKPKAGKSQKQVKEDAMPPVELMEYFGEEGYENDRNEEIDELKARFRLASANEKNRREDYMDDDFYSCIVFTNKEQRKAFFTALGVKCDHLTDLHFINGVALAALMGVELPAPSVMPPARFKQSKSVMALTHLPKQNGKQTT